MDEHAADLFDVVNLPNTQGNSCYQGKANKPT